MSKRKYQTYFMSGSGPNRQQKKNMSGSGAEPDKTYVQDLIKANPDKLCVTVCLMQKLQKCLKLMTSICKLPEMQI